MPSLLPKRMVFPAGLWLIAALVFAAELPAADSRPNIVLILADDLGYGDARCYNPHSRIPTPHIDRLAERGMRFTDAHAPGTVCVPTRYGLLTGRYPFRQDYEWSEGGLIPKDRPTLASLLRQNGYRTAMVGKWHLGFEQPDGHGGVHREGPVDRGFDSYFGLPASLDIPPYYFIRDRHPVAAPTEQIEGSRTPGWERIQGVFYREGKIAPDFEFPEVLPTLADEAVNVIDSHREDTPDRPFFLYFALPAPHTPWVPLERYRGESGAGLYGDFVVQVDETVGQVVEALERHGIAEETLLVFTSDNGPVWFPQDVLRFAHRSSGPYRGIKGDAWEGGHRMPFIVRWPGVVEPGSVSDALVCQTDLMATIAAILGVELPEEAGEDSFNILPVLKGQLGSPRKTLAVEARPKGPVVIRQGKWKLIPALGSIGFSEPRRVEPVAGGPQGQLYDLEADPGETNNLYLERPEVVDRLESLMQKLRDEGRSRQ